MPNDDDSPVIRQIRRELEETKNELVKTKSQLRARSLTDLGIDAGSHNAVLTVLKDVDAGVWDSADTLKDAVTTGGLGALIKSSAPPQTADGEPSPTIVPPVIPGQTDAEMRIEALRTQSTPPPPATPPSHREQAAAATAAGDPMEAIRALSQWTAEQGASQR